MKKVSVLTSLFLALGVASTALCASATELLHTVTVELDAPKQKMMGFGASDAWSVEEVGLYYPDAQRQQAATWLFSKAMSPEGEVEGIGLSMWRFNIGGGSAEQGNDAQITNPVRRIEGFLQDDGSYHWDKQRGQQWFLRQAHDFGVEQLVAFSNSPPVQYTQNGIGHGSRGVFDANLKAENYDDFARFLGDVLAHFNSEGIVFDYISPLNEPQYQWADNKQEGSPWKNNQIAQLTRLLNGELSQRKLATQIMLSEAAEYRYLSGRDHPRNKAFHSNQIDAFFHPDSPDYIGDLKHVPKMIAGHSYWTVYNDEQIRSERRQLSDKAKEYGLTFFQSEYCLLGLENITDHKPDLDELDIALFMAKIIHYDLTEANAASWSFWTSMSRTNARALNRYLLIEKQDNRGQDFTNARVRASKSLWVLGNYSRFIRPGYVRMETHSASAQSDLLVSSYLSPDSTELVSVIVNLSDAPTSVSVNAGKQYHHHGIFVSNEEHNLALFTPAESGIVNVPAKSVVTLLSNQVK